MDQTAILREIFDMRGMPAAIALFDRLEHAEDLSKKIQGADNEHVRQAMIMRSSTLSQWQFLKSAIEAVRIELFDLSKTDLNKALGHWVNFLRDNRADIAKKIAKYLGFIIRNLDTIIPLIIKLTLVTTTLFILNQGFLALSRSVALVNAALMLTTGAGMMGNLSKLAGLFMASFAAARLGGAGLTLASLKGLAALAVPLTQFAFILAGIVASLDLLNQLAFGGDPILWNMVGGDSLEAYLDRNLDNIYDFLIGFRDDFIFVFTTLYDSIANSITGMIDTVMDKIRDVANSPLGRALLAVTPGGGLLTDVLNNTGASAPSDDREFDRRLDQLNGRGGGDIGDIVQMVNNAAVVSGEITVRDQTNGSTVEVQSKAGSMLKLVNSGDD
jgi:hypothetical protein